MPKPLNILHVFGCMNRGGAEMRTLDVMRHAHRGRFRFHFVALSGLPGDLDDEIRALGGEVHLLPLGLTFPWRFRRLLRRHRFDAVHSHVHYPSGYFLRLAAKEGVGVRVTHFRCTEDGRRPTLRRRLQRHVLRRWIDRYSTHILAVSRGAMEAGRGADWASDPRCQVVYNGIDSAPYSAPRDRQGVGKEFGFPPSATLYIHVGRMDEPKNHLRLASIFSEVLRLDPDSRLLLVGRGGNDIERRLRARLVELGASDRVIFAGLRTDVPRLLKAADAMLFPSLNEGLPGAVLEACAAGTPVLASRLPVIEEVASQFPSVETLSLETADALWAQRALAVAERGRINGTRQDLCAAFAARGFAIGPCVAANERVWAGSGGLTR